MFVGLFVLSLVIISTHSVSVHNQFYCYSEDPIRSWTALGDIHTPYEHVRGRSISASVSTCNPSKFWMLSRHGARLPLYTELPNMFGPITTLHSEILTHYNQGRTSLCAPDIEMIRNWKLDPNITFDVAGDLTESGWNEMKGIAQRYQAAFPTILSSTYSPSEYFFRSTDFQRTRFSLRAFADGLFGVNGNEQVVYEDIPEPDIFMRPYENCPLYEALIYERSEQQAFREGPEYQEMIIQVSAKLGFYNSHVLRNISVNFLAVQCKFEQTWDWNSKHSFCAAFSVANAQVIEYSQDLDHYIRVGYGRPQYRRLYENLLCFHMQDMLRFMQSTNHNDFKTKIYNGHVNLLLILMHFEVFDSDVPLTRHNFAQQSQRAWRSSVLLPMAANLAVIRFE